MAAPLDTQHSGGFASYCGLFCGACVITVAIKGNQLEQLAEKLCMTPEDLFCGGCKSESLAMHCGSCMIRQCAIERGVAVCGECSEYPCRLLQAFNDDQNPHHSAVIRNQERIRRIGLKDWLEEQERRWTCSGCGTPFSWYDTTCSLCGAPLRDAVMEMEQNA
ncbi:DUF3795 domain-containing protein [bacterium]|nr:DUF3795 domain-containing protein [candidate division CSSED10-310 bacterium]